MGFVGFVGFIGFIGFIGLLGSGGQSSFMLCGFCCHGRRCGGVCSLCHVFATGMAVWQGISLRNQTRETPLRKPRDYAITDLHSSQQLVMHPRMYTNPEPFGWSANHFMVSPDGQKFPLVKYVPNL